MNLDLVKSEERVKNEKGCCWSLDAETYGKIAEKLFKSLHKSVLHVMFTLETIRYNCAFCAAPHHLCVAGIKFDIHSRPFIVRPAILEKVLYHRFTIYYGATSDFNLILWDAGHILNNLCIIILVGNFIYDSGCTLIVLLSQNCSHCEIIFWVFVREKIWSGWVFSSTVNMFLGCGELSENSLSLHWSNGRDLIQVARHVNVRVFSGCIVDKTRIQLDFTVCRTNIVFFKLDRICLVEGVLGVRLPSPPIRPVRL